MSVTPEGPVTHVLYLSVSSGWSRGRMWLVGRAKDHNIGCVIRSVVGPGVCDGREHKHRGSGILAHLFRRTGIMKKHVEI